MSRPFHDATPAAPNDALEPHRIHAALYRPILFAGVEPAVMLIEISTTFALVFGIGLHVATVLLALFYLTIVHGTMAWVAQRDPGMIALYVRSLSGRDFYPPHAILHAPSPRAYPAIPDR